MTSRSVLFFLLFLISAGTAAQDKKALFYLDQGERAFKQQRYAEALTQFEKYFEKDSSSQLAYIRSAQIYESYRNSTKAISYYKKAISLDSNKVSYPQAYMYLGSRALEAGLFKEAKKYLLVAINSTNKNALVYKQLQNQLNRAEVGISAMENPLRITPVRLPDEINAREKQYFPVLTADGNTLIFTAVAEGGDENLYISKKVSDEWQKPESISSSINTTFNEGTCSISADGKIMVFTACQGRKTFGSCDLFISKLQGNVWSEPENMGPSVNSSHWDSQPSLSADGSKLYFSSDRPKGFGKKDLWMSSLDEKGVWTEAVNMGPEINTDKDEVSPFIHANGYSLFYSSNGKEGLGNHDIYLCDIRDESERKSLNLGYPINTIGDESGLFISADGKTAFYSRQEQESTQIYQFDIPEVLAKQFNRTYYLKGIVKDEKTGQPLFAALELINPSNGQTVSKFFSDPVHGDYLSVVPEKGAYSLYVKAGGYFFKSLNFQNLGKADNKNLDIYLTKIEKEAKETLENIFFDTGSAALRPESAIALEKLYELLKQNSNLRIEISGHTDDVGSNAANQELSDQRATAVVKYLRQKGIEAEKMKAKGYGESQPKVKNDSEANRQLNRRIEMKIL